MPISENRLDHHITELAYCLDSRLIDGVVGLEGSPFAGKSTLASRLAAAKGAVIVAEHTDFDQMARTTALEPWPEGASQAIYRQRVFAEVELRRTEEAERLTQLGQVVIMDRTALSVLMYSVCRAITNGCEPLLQDAVRLAQTTLRVPARILLLDGEPSLLLSRAAKLVEMGTPRLIEAYLLMPDTLALLRSFYTLLASRLSHCKVTVIPITDDITHGADECNTSLLDITELWPHNRLPR